MRACTIAVGALLSFASPALAEPAKSDAPKPAPEQKPATTILASADTVHTPATSSPQATTAPVKRVVPRITTCRCGDPQPDPENPEQ